MISKKLIKKDIRDFNLTYKTNKYKYYIHNLDPKIISCYIYNNFQNGFGILFTIELLFKSKNYKIVWGRQEYLESIMAMFLYCKFIKNEK